MQGKLPHWNSSPGFTLAELLISLAILGVIATFTIPKVLTNQQNSKYNAAAKEAISSISTVFSTFQLNGQITSASTSKDMINSLNYVSLATSGQIDDKPNASVVVNCATSTPCIRLHNGGIIRANSVSFNGTATTNAIEFLFDPDGLANGSAPSIQFLIYINGRVTSRDKATAGTTNSSGNTYGPDTQYDPAWFSW